MLKGLSKQERAGRNRYQRRDSAAAVHVAAAFAPRWTQACSGAFEAIKSDLSTSPVLVLPDQSNHFTLVSNACQTPRAVGAVLMQDGHPVSFFSCKLSGPELNYSVSDIEMLVVICALKEWRCYLEGARFTIVSDHQPNTDKPFMEELRGIGLFNCVRAAPKDKRFGENGHVGTRSCQSVLPGTETGMLWYFLSQRKSR